MPPLSTSDRPPAPPPTTTKAQKAFTLIELLVVVSIITLLMALLFPALRRARRQAEAVVCQANLHQWATILQQYTSENDGRWVHVRLGSYTSHYWWQTISAGYRGELKPIDQCPTKRWQDNGRRRASVYSPNDWIHDCQHWDEGASHLTARYYWRRVDATRSPGRVPALLDGPGWVWSTPFATDEPPPHEEGHAGRMGRFCDTRHGSFVNSVFMDWSVRKVGLKELWTLKWHREFDTAGPWTKAGGVLPEDWPPWMRQLKDY